MDLVTKALRAGEGRKFKAYQKRAEAINRFEPEMEALSDEEIRAEADSCASAPATASRSTTCCRRPSRSPARPRAGRPASATTTSS